MQCSLGSAGLGLRSASGGPRRGAAPRTLSPGAGVAPRAAPRPFSSGAPRGRGGRLPTRRRAADASSGAAELPPEPQKRTLLQRVKRFFIGDGLDKERIKALGMGAFASYGFISNLNYGTALGMAWIAFVKRYGVSPMAPGQWPAFLAFYAGFWALQNFARPLRLSLALALAPAFDRGITSIGQRLKISKGAAFGIFLFCMAVFTSTALFGSLYLLGGFPATK
ncbi:MAG: hypothetical protein J3K34DRAFT_517126 [Monoraphidium minutum]|nr:MAG: hypothetical protein J3K34DRAFT_517126 [Monoraphidium minutum]